MLYSCRYKLIIADAEFTQLGIVNQSTNSVKAGNYRTGLYDLRVDIPDDITGVITSFCALGVVNTEQYNGNVDSRNVCGRLALLVVTKEVVVESSILKQDNKSTVEVCINTSIHFNTSKGSEVSILVAIPSSCVEDQMLGSILCPLQVDLEGRQSDSDYYSDSDVAVGGYFVDGNTTSIVNLLNSPLETVVTKTSINVRVGIETEGTVSAGSQWVLPCNQAYDSHII